MAVVRLVYPPDLPVSEHKDEILAAVRDHQVVVLAGETGSGKTTQLPKICLELGRGVNAVIGHTQPRRLAARTVAERLAEELDEPLGGLVGYRVRFTDVVGEATRVQVMTDGILLAEIQRDRLLRRYDTLIIDEAHERSLNIDFLLGYVKTLLGRRPDLKVIITSATIDTERFSRHFDAPVVEVSGRSYPVEVRYRPFGDDPERAVDQVQAIGDAVVEAAGEGPGDVLVFLSGEREIRDTAEALRDLALPDTEILPLYARLSAAEQHRVFRPHSGRRVVLATNVAETSLTVPGVRYVIDAGTARISRYSRRTKVQRLPIEPVSRASADQRAGRCGRIGPGVCIRLYSEEDYLGRPEFTEPEILRTNLASVILQMAAVGLGDMSGFPFVDPPDARAVKDGIALLEELGAFERSGHHRRLSPRGRRLAQLPLDPRLARMVLEAEANGCLREVTVIAAALSILDPRERPAGQEQAADAAHARFATGDSDLLSYLRLWEYLQERQAEMTSSQFRKLCRSEYLNYLRVREWQDVCGQLRFATRGLGLRPNRQAGAPYRIHLSLLAGLLSHVGMWDPARREYRGARNARFAIARSSVLHQRSARWVMAAELVETNRMWARNAARIRPEWAEKAGDHLVKRTHSQPFWDSARGAAMVDERVTLYGLPLVAGRPVALSRTDPDTARQMFVQHALVEGEWAGDHEFQRHNDKLLEELRQLEDRARRRDLVVGDDVIFALYDERVPSEVVSARTFERWWARARRDRPDLLTFPAEALISPGAAGVDLGAFPDSWRQGDLVLPLVYEFDPGSDHDGVTVEVPVAQLNQVQPSGFDWQVPGFREELVTALIRLLPKPVRRHLVPAADHARAFLERTGPPDGPLEEALRGELGRMAGVEVPAAGWGRDRLPPHLVVHFRVTDEGGRVLSEGDDLEELKCRLQGRMSDALAGATSIPRLSGRTEWEFGTIPPVVETAVSGLPVRAYPALVDEGATVGLELLPSPEEQSGSMWVATRRLLLLAVPAAPAQVERGLANRARLALARAPGGSTQALADCLECAADRILSEHGGPAWEEAGFDALRAAARRHLGSYGLAVAQLVADALETAAAIRERADSLRAAVLRPAAQDIHRQLDSLLAPGFATRLGWERLGHLRRYLAAVERRLDKLPESPQRDRQRMETVGRLETALAGVAGDSRATEIRWLIEELRVSLWAQTLGTPEPVSESRIRRAIAGLRR